jgi:hypothetical protein
MMEPIDFMGEFVRELTAQLALDNQRWGDTWLKRSRKGQGDRIYDRLKQYYQDAKLGKALLVAGDEEEPLFVDSLPWLKIAGLALIGWIRDRYPEHFPDY